MTPRCRKLVPLTKTKSAAIAGGTAGPWQYQSMCCQSAWGCPQRGHCAGMPVLSASCFQLGPPPCWW
eukprot:3260130-Amphidinium_carterae.1